MQLHDAYSKATPSQRMAAIEHRRRMERITSAARQRRCPPVLPPPVLPPIPNEELAKAAAIMTWPKIVPGQIETILRAVLVHFPDVGMGDLKSARRMAEVVRARQIAMYLIREHTNRTLPDIGRRLGGRDHTTVLHAVRKVAAEIKVNHVLAEQIEKIAATIKDLSA